MKNRKTLKKLILGGLLLLTTGSVFAQTQKVHTLQAKNSSGTTTMNSDALIQMDSDNKGLLLPRIALTGANKVAPLTAHTAGMVVYNTANVPASGSGATAIEAVAPGYYYNDGTKWVKIANTDTADITDDAWVNNTTTNVVELGTKSDGTTARVTGEEVVITDGGKMGIGTETPTQKLHINGTGVNQDNRILIGDDFDLEALGLVTAGTGVSPFAENKTNSIRFSRKAKFNIPLEIEDYSFLEGSTSRHFHVARGTQGITFAGAVYGASNGTSMLDKNRTTLARYPDLAHYDEKFKNSFKIWHKVEGVRKSIISLERDGSINLINGDWNTVPTLKALNGNVGIGTTVAPTERLEVVGNGKFTGTVSTTGVLTTSDKRFKQGVTPVTSAMQTVNKLQPVSYTWSTLGKKKGGDNKKHIGFIAQEVEKVLPNLVNTDATGYKSVNYIEVIPVLTKALQEQQKAIEKQQKEIDELKAMVKKLLK